MSTLFLFLFALLGLILSAFFSGMEIAFISSSKLKIELDNKKGQFSAKILSFFSSKPAWFIAAMLIGNNIAPSILGTGDYAFAFTFAAITLIPCWITGYYLTRD